MTVIRNVTFKCLKTKFLSISYITQNMSLLCLYFNVSEFTQFIVIILQLTTAYLVNQQIRTSSRRPIAVEYHSRCDVWMMKIPVIANVTHWPRLIVPENAGIPLSLSNA